MHAASSQPEPLGWPGSGFSRQPGTIAAARTPCSLPLPASQPATTSASAHHGAPRRYRPLMSGWVQIWGDETAAAVAAAGVAARPLVVAAPTG